VRDSGGGKRRALRLGRGQGGLWRGYLSTFAGLASVTYIVAAVTWRAQPGNGRALWYTLGALVIVNALAGLLTGRAVRFARATD
jgi:hypothetical protein